MWAVGCWRREPTGGLSRLGHSTLGRVTISDPILGSCQDQIFSILNHGQFMAGRKWVQFHFISHRMIWCQEKLSSCVSSEKIFLDISYMLWRERGSEHSESSIVNLPNTDTVLGPFPWMFPLVLVILLSFTNELVCSHLCMCVTSFVRSSVSCFIHFF